MQLYQLSLLLAQRKGPYLYHRLAKKQLVRNRSFSFTASVSRNEPRINDFEKLFRIKESRNSLSDSLVRTGESRNINLAKLIRNSESRNTFFH